MNFQIDIKPVIIGKHIKPHFIMVQYIDDWAYKSTIDKEQLELMIQNNVVAKVTRQVKNDLDGSIQNFEYPEGVDGAGVMYTSKLYEIKEQTI